MRTNVKELLQTKKCKYFLTAGIIIAVVIVVAVLLIKGDNFTGDPLVSQTTGTFNEENSRETDKKYLISEFMARAVKAGFDCEYREVYSTTANSEFDIVSANGFTKGKLVLTVSEGEIKDYSVEVYIYKTDPTINSDEGLYHDVEKIHKERNSQTLAEAKKWSKALMLALDSKKEINDAKISSFVQLIDAACAEKETQTMNESGYSVYAAYEVGDTEDTLIFAVNKESIDV